MSGQKQKHLIPIENIGLKTLYYDREIMTYALNNNLPFELNSPFF